MMREFIGKTPKIKTQAVILKTFKEITYDGDHEMANFLALIHKCILELGEEQTELHMTEIIEPPPYS